jgi:rare lipoprotein A
MPIIAVWAVLSIVPASQLVGVEQSSRQQQAAEGNNQQKQTFEGKITRSDEGLTLQDNAKGVNYKLDDQQLVVFFEGKEVKVTGTLDSKTDAIYISDIGLSEQKHAVARAAFHRPRTRMLQYGLASWYERRNQGPRTASGELFDDRALTAAHLRLPLGTRVKVTNLRNGRSVLVRINDRGPFVPGRLIDLSKGAAERLGFKHQGLTLVRTSVVSFPSANPAS